MSAPETSAEPISEPVPEPTVVPEPTAVPAPEATTEPVAVQSAEYPSEPEYIITLDQLMSSQTAAIQQETDDRIALAQFVTPNKTTLSLKFMQWVAQGFPAFYVLLTFIVAPPNVCSDGVVRSVYEYVSFLINNDLGVQILMFQNSFKGMQMSYKISGNVLTIHVSKA